MDEGESEIDCARREILEEVGYQAGDKITENDYFERMTRGHMLRLYVIPGVPESTPFQTHTIGEVSVRVLSFLVSPSSTSTQILVCSK